MARLYLANLSKQTHEFHYRVPAEAGWSRRVQIQTIAPGTQQMIHAEAPLPVLEAIIDQHRQYGLVEASEVVKTKGFIGLCFSFDVPVDLDKLHYGMDHNQGALYDMGTKRREEAAAAFDMAVETNLLDAQHRGELRGSARVKSVAVETLEESDSPKFGEGVRVDHLMPVDGGRRRA